MAYSKKILPVTGKIYWFICLVHQFASIFSSNVDSDQRIVYGKPAEDGEFPYFVSIRFKTGPNKNLCGGSILNEDTIVTAVHCLYDIPPSLKSIWIHLNYDNKYNEFGPRYPGKPIVHDNIRKRGGHDIAVVKLSSPLDLGDAIKPIRLPSKSFASGTRVTVAGFRRRNVSIKDEARILMKHSMVLVESCKATYKCAKPIEGFTCYGDSGGPMVYKGPGGNVEQDELVALVSGGNDNCTSKVEFHTDIYYFLDWLEEKMRLKLSRNSK